MIIACGWAAAVGMASVGPTGLRALHGRALSRIWGAAGARSSRELPGHLGGRVQGAVGRSRWQLVASNGVLGSEASQ